MKKDQTTGPANPVSPGTCVVVGPHAVSARRAVDADIAIIALVDAHAPDQAVLAQAAGADVVLPTHAMDLEEGAEVPGLALATRAAMAIAHRRREIARSANRVSHDLVGTFNVMSMATELAESGAATPELALSHVSQALAEGAADAWRAARPERSIRRPLNAVELNEAVRGLSEDYDAEIVTADAEAWVFADERELTATAARFLDYARHRDERARLEVLVEHDAVVLRACRNGTAPSSAVLEAIEPPDIVPPSRDEFDIALATAAEFAADLGGTLRALQGQGDWPTVIEMRLPRIDDDQGDLAAREMAIDQASAQANILELVVRNAPLSESLEAVVSAMEDHLPGSLCSVLLLRNGTSLHHGAGANLAPEYRDAIDGVVIGTNVGSCGTAAFIQQPYIATDIATDEAWVDYRDLALAHGLRSCWSTPITNESGEVLGTFAVYKTTPWSPDQSAVKLVGRFTHLARVAIEHHRLFRALAESESRFRSAFDGSTVGIALTQLDGTLLQANPALVKLLGRAAGRTPSNLLDAIHPDARAAVQAAWDDVGSTDWYPPRDRPPIETRLVSEFDSAGEVWVSLSASLIVSGSDSHLLVEVRDITENRQHQAAQRARHAAEAASRAKTDFLALVSHELRTPLNAILGFAQVMQLSGASLDTEQLGDSVNQIVLAGEHLRDLIDDLLDLSRIESGALSVQVEPLDAGRVIDEALDLVESLAAARHTTLHFQRGGDEAWILADRRCAHQVLLNLLGNAVKYTPPHGRIDVRTETRPDGTIRITVADNGPGIPAESIDRLFLPFRRLDQHQRQSKSGSGLGLALAARLMEAMSGSIGVESLVGVGSKFWVDFPAAPDPTKANAAVRDEAAGAPEPTPEPQALTGAILYVEDDPSSVAVMARVLQRQPGVELRTADSVASGRTALAEGGLDLVVLDIGLPDGSGWDLLRRIRSNDEHLPVIVLTAEAGATPADGLRVDHLLTKPIDVSRFLAAVDSVLSGPPSGDDGAELLDPLEQ